MKGELNKFIWKIEGFTKMAQTEQVMFFAFFFLKIKNKTHFSYKDISNIFELADIPSPTNIHSVFNVLCERKTFIKDRGGFKLHRDTWEKIEATVNKVLGAKKISYDESEYFNFWSVIHKDVASISKKKFEDGHFADAVESAFKEINMRVKEIVKKKTGEEYDGADLMYRAFSSENPLIVIEDISTRTGTNIQKGYMQIFAGSMTGIRNPKAHENLVITKDNAIHLMFLASQLMNIIDASKVNSDKKSGTKGIVTEKF